MPMVKATSSSSLGSESLDHDHDESSLELRTGRSGEAVYAGFDPHNKVVLEGSDLSHDGDMLVGGTISDIAFTESLQHVQRSHTSDADFQLV
jgi:hypothetical protein